MYVITIDNSGEKTVIHDDEAYGYIRTSGGKIAENVNAIPSFEFTIFPGNPAFNGDNFKQLITKINVYDQSRIKSDFIGRVLTVTDSMDTNGVVSKQAICEGELGYLCDSMQPPKAITGGTLSTTVLSKLIHTHNATVDESKRFEVGTCEIMGFPEGSGYDWGNTFDTLQALFVDTLGGEIRLRYQGKKRYIDFAKQFGEQKDTPIKLAVNMRSISRSQTMGSLVTRLYPLGGRNTAGNRLTIETDPRAEGKTYIDNAELIAKYGIICGTVLFDDIAGEGQYEHNAAVRLYSRGLSYFNSLNKKVSSYKVSALDLSLTDDDYETFELYNSYKAVNRLTGTDEYIRVTGRTINLDNRQLSDLTFGDNQSSMTKMIAKKYK